MKRIIVLTSILALSACGGGSGGGGNYVAPGAVETPFVPLTDTVASSNSEITGMVSNSEAQVVTYVVNKLGNDAETVGLGGASRPATIRGAFTPSVSAGSDDYSKARELMELAQWLGQADTTYEDITSLFNKSKTDQNKIKSALKLLDDMYCYVGGSADETARRILEQRNQNKFEKPLEEIKDKSEIILLKNVTFRTIDSGELAIMKFSTKEDGTIDGIINTYFESRPPQPDEDCGGPWCTEEVVSTSQRLGDTDIFYGYERIEEEDFGPEYAGKLTKIPEKYISYGKKLGLKYSDFGVMRFDLTLIDQDDPELKDLVAQMADIWGVQDTAFIGGYDNKLVTPERVTELAAAENDGKIVFNGLAHASVSRYDFSLPGNGAEEPLADGGMDDTNATLTVDGRNGTQTLAAKFDNWYDIAVIKHADGTDEFKFIGTNKGGDDRFDDPSGRDDYHDASNIDMGAHKALIFETQYYGDNGTPSEAVAHVQHERVYGPEVPRENGNNDWQYHLNVNVGFGGTRK